MAEVAGGWAVSGSRSQQSAGQPQRRVSLLPLQACRRPPRAPVRVRSPVLLLLLLSLASVGLQICEGSIQLLQWNPHWQCFVWNVSGCATHARELATSYLETHDVDFANLIEFEGGLELPENWKVLSSGESTCSKDLTLLVYNAARWQPTEVLGESARGCMAADDRPFIVQAFRPLDRWAVGRDGVVVVGAHFDHQGHRGTQLLREALDKVVSTSGYESVVLIADTNESPRTTSEEIANILQLVDENHTAQSTELRRTCCENIHFPVWGTYDRIIANFGEAMDTTVLMDETPDWAHQERHGVGGAFHKPLLGTLHLYLPPRPTNAGEDFAESDAEGPGALPFVVGGAFVIFGLVAGLVVMKHSPPSSTSESLLKPSAVSASPTPSTVSPASPTSPSAKPLLSQPQP